MSLEQNLQWEQEEGPGTFLSLSAQAPSSSSSSSPFRALAAAETSPREAVKQDQGDLETCLSLQQPSRRAIGQQTAACLQEPQPSRGEQHTFAYLQKPQPGQTLGQQTVPYLEGPRDEQKTAAFLEQQMTLYAAEQPEPSEHQKPSSPEYEKPASFQIPSEQQRPASLKGLLKGPPDQQKPPTWIALVEQQKPLSFLGLSEKPKPASLHGRLEQQKSVASLGFPSSLQGISEQQKVGFPLQPNPVSLQGQQKQCSLPVFSEQQMLGSSPEQEKTLSLQGFAQEHKVASPHRPQVSSLQPDQQKDVSFPGHLFQGPPDDQKVVFPPKQPPEQQKLAVLQAPPDQLKLTSAQGSSEQHKSVVMQAHSLQGRLDQQKSSLQGPSDQQKPESMQGCPEQLVFPLQGTLEQQKVFRGHFLQPQQGFSFQPTKAGVPSSEPIVVSNLLAQNGLPKEKEHPLPMQSPRRCLASQGAEQVYPAPMATHNAVLADQRLFIETLQSLHAALGVQMSFPKIGESDLDLYKLYKEVTCRGGLEVVMRDGKWKEVALALNFPPSVMTASCILRSSYISTLHHYEQVYFFGACGRIIPPPAAYATESPAISEQEDVSMFSQGIAELGSGQNITNGIIDSAQALGVDPASSVGAMVTGAIDGKFDNGYLVTVMVGARKMRGVLYHVASTNALPQNACVPGMMQIVGSELKSADLVPTVGRKRKKTEIFRKDPNAPRQNRTGYNFFFAEQRAKLKTMQPDKDRAISKMIGDLWNKLSQDEKTPYQAQGVKDKERYVREMREYKEKIKLPLIALNNSMAVPPRLPSTYISEASNHSKAVPPQLPFTYVSEALNVSQAAPLLMGNATLTPEQEPTVDTMSNASLVVNAPNAAMVVYTPKASTVVDTSVASTVADTSTARWKEPEELS